MFLSSTNTPRKPSKTENQGTMALDSAELVKYARDCASRGDDLYALLGVDATTPKDDIHRAWRRAGLKYHPDKAGDSYDPEKYESFERARDVLCDPPAREAYDNGLRAALQKKRRVEEMSSERRRFVEELERAEREAKRPKTDATQDKEGGLTQAERSRVAEAGRRRMEERARLMREAEERSRRREKERPDGPGTPTATNTTTATSNGGQTSTPTRPPRDEKKAGQDDGTPSASTPAATDGDEYDNRIADLEKRLREKQERKAARKLDKRSRKSDVSSLSSGLGAGDTPTKPHSSLNPGTDESKADGEKGPESRSFSFRPYAASAPSSPAATTKASGSGGSLPQFAATMARLKAAQARRDEEKRKRAEAAGEQAA